MTHCSSKLQPSAMGARETISESVSHSGHTTGLPNLGEWIRISALQLGQSVVWLFNLKDIVSSFDRNDGVFCPSIQLANHFFGVLQYKDTVKSGRLSSDK